MVLEVSVVSENDEQDASRLHLIPSAEQRPLNYKAGLKARPVWELAELRSQNRWTNVQSMTGLSQLSDKLNSIMEHFTQILHEASDLTKDLDEFWTPVSLSKTQPLSNHYILPGFPQKIQLHAAFILVR